MPSDKTRDGVIGPAADKGTKGSGSLPVDGDPAPVQGKRRDDPPPPTGDQGTKSGQSLPVEGK